MTKLVLIANLRQNSLKVKKFSPKKVSLNVITPALCKL